jgi:hypothetical protein
MTHRLASLKRVIERAARSPRPTDEQRRQGQRRVRRFFALGIPIMVLLGAGIGRMIGGATGAIWMGALISLSMGAGLWLSRDALRR